MRHFLTVLFLIVLLLPARVMSAGETGAPDARATAAPAALVAAAR